MTVSFILNGEEIKTKVSPDKVLVDFLREDMHLTGTKVGCEVGECGACTVIMNGKAVNSCLIPLGAVEGASITTIEGVHAADGGLHPIQEAFIEAGAVQCGYCIPGMVLSAKALLDQNAAPSDDEIAVAMSGNLCRCTGYRKILEGVKIAAEKLQAGEKGAGA